MIAQRTLDFTGTGCSSAWQLWQTVAEHSYHHWTERVCCEQRGWALWDLPDEFARWSPIGIPGEGFDRLHAPTDLGIVYKRDCRNRPVGTRHRALR